MTMQFTTRAILIIAVLLTWVGFAVMAPPCPDCGTNPVPYPLSTGPACGDQLYKIRCDAGKLYFDTVNDSYPITSISPTTQQLVIRPAAFIDNKTCVTTDLPQQGIQLDPALPFNITLNNTVILLNCSDATLGSPRNCTPASLCYTYINGSTEGSVCGAAPICCTYETGGFNPYCIRISDARCRAYQSFVNLNESLPVSEWPEPGVEIQWMLPLEPPCSAQDDCDINSRCRATEKGISRCFCEHKFHWDPVAGICASNSECKDPEACRRSKRDASIAALVCIPVTIFLMALLGRQLYNRQLLIKEEHQRIARERREILSASAGGKSAKIFTGKEIKKATNNFSRNGLLGTGGFGDVYKGVLEDGTTVAVKCAKLGSTKGNDQVLNEVRILCQVNHKDLVQLLGCCVELENPLLVYEYISNGTLSDHLSGKRGWLTWKQRLKIARDTAEGLAYLHFSAVPPIYHRDVKSSNILLDDNMNAKVADFGLSRLAQTDATHVTTRAQGTLGYLDPEYYRSYQVTDKSDVYSFGIVLLELLTSQRAIDFNRPSDDLCLAAYVKRVVAEERLADVIDPQMKEGASGLELETMKALGFLAMSCIEECRTNRPSMREVLEEIEYIISIATEEAE